MAEKAKPRADQIRTNVAKGNASLTKEERSSKAMPKRITAFIIWALAIGCEVGAIYCFNTMSVLWPVLAFLIADAVLCIVASLFWKKANHIDPPKGKFLQNQLGVFMCLLAFLPLGFFLVKGSDTMSAKNKKIISIVAAVAVAAAVFGSIDYNPVTEETLAEAEAAANGGYVYWGKYSKSYHLDPECQSLVNSKEVFEGYVSDAFELGKTDPCDFCAGGKEAKESGE